MKASIKRRRAMKTRLLKSEDGGWPMRSVRRRVQPRSWRRLAATLAMLSLAWGLRGQDYSINWHKIAGGGTSTNGQFTLSGTIGQHDAGGPMTGGNYSLTGGFWALFSVVQTPGAPRLIIVPATPGNAQISWTPDTGTNWVLQETLSLSPTNWMNSASGFTNPVTVPATLPTKFYRLFKP
jgi:hypothetical protein